MSAYEFIRTEKANFPVAAMCKVMGVSRSAFYAWLERKPSERERQHEALLEQVQAVYSASKCRYGSPRVHRALRKQGMRVSRKSVARAMRESGLFARRKKHFKVTTNSRHTKRIAPNLLARDFEAEHPNEAWVTDVKAVRTRSGWVYLAAILDLYARRVVGWALSESNDTALALSALQRALVQRKPPPGLIHHSDRGSPYGSDDYIEALDAAGCRRSMSKKGDCWDNAVAESFFSTIEHECLRGATIRGAERAFVLIGEYIETFYNCTRLHSPTTTRARLSENWLSLTAATPHNPLSAIWGQAQAVGASRRR